MYYQKRILSSIITLLIVNMTFVSCMAVATAKETASDTAKPKEVIIAEPISDEKAQIAAELTTAEERKETIEIHKAAIAESAQTVQTNEEVSEQVEYYPEETYNYNESYSEQTYSEPISSEEWYGDVLTKSGGVAYGPSGKETYYNLPMGGVISNMQELGYNEEYWVREDGVKMYGDYVMIAANLDTHPMGSIVETSLGEGIVCDTGGFAEYDPYQVDVAVNW